MPILRVCDRTHKLASRVVPDHEITFGCPGRNEGESLVAAVQNSQFFDSAECCMNLVKSLADRVQGEELTTAVEIVREDATDYGLPTFIPRRLLGF